MNYLYPQLENANKLSQRIYHTVICHLSTAYFILQEPIIFNTFVR